MVTAQQAGSAKVADTVPHPSSRVTGVARYLHNQDRVIPCLNHTTTRQRKGVIMHIPQLVCLNDGIEMVIDQTGHVVNLLSDNGHAIKVSSDAWRCPVCGTRIARMADAAIAGNWEEKYGATNAHSTAKFVN